MIRRRPGFRRHDALRSRPTVHALEPRRLLSAFMVKDLNTTPPFQQAPSPAGFFEVNDALLFGAPDGVPYVLYRTDGTPAGTAPLHPVNRTVFIGDETPHVTIGNVAYFAGATQAHGAELWRTDGTAAGTVMVKDIYPGPISAGPLWLTDVGGTLYFAATDPQHERELWKSDGTAAGTVRVSETPLGPLTNAIREIEAVGDAVYFASYGDITQPGVLWKSDGTTAGTTAVEQFRGGTNTPSDLEALGDLLVFNGFDTTNATEPWVSDGTPEGTRLLKDVRPGSGSSASNAYGYFPFGGAAYFSAATDATGAELWKTDGTPEGTVLVEDLWPGTGGADPNRFVEMNGAMYFFAFLSDGVTGSTYLWRSDGTAEATFPLKAVPGGTRLVRSGSTLFAGGTDGVWKSDGTAAGTLLVKPFGNAVHSLTPFRGGAAFQAQLGGQWGYWYTDGTPAGTVLLGDLDQRTVGSVPATGPMAVSFGDRVVFAAVASAGAVPGTSGNLLVTDGTAAGTRRLSNPTDLRHLTQAGGVAYFFAQAFQDIRHLWRTDGTEAGTYRVLDTMFAHGQPLAIGSTLYFGAQEFTGGGDPPVGLYRSDGTAAGTVRVKALPAQRSIPANITRVGNDVYFTTSYSGGWAFDLWKSDGTEAGTVVVKQFAGGTTAYVPTGLTDVNGKLVFRTHRGNGDIPQIWVSDGTSNGTVSLAVFGPTSGGSFDLSLTALNGAAYFVGAGPGQGTSNVELWKTDGTFEGTVRVKDINPGPEGSNPRGMTVFDGRLYFAAVEPTAGMELWSTDGTDAGTTRVTDLRPGTGGSFPTPLRAVAGRLYFTANDGSRGTELWSTDGTAAGTSIVHDVHPTSAGAGAWPVSPVPLANPVAGDRILFWADDGLHGVEPWSAPRPGAPANDFVRGRHLFYNNSRFDGRTPGGSLSDDGAIAPDKRPLPSAAGPGFENVSGYSRGLNGIMIDLNTRLPMSGDIRLSYRVGTGAAGSPWAAAPEPLSVTRRNQGLPKDIDRVTVIWADGAIRNTWLEVTVEALLDGAVAGRDVFYFGHLGGETGDEAPAGLVAAVGAGDLARTRSAAGTRGVGPGNRYDHNRDGAVNVLDLNVVRGNFFASLRVPVAGAPAVEPASGSGSAQRKLGSRYRPAVSLGLTR